MSFIGLFLIFMLIQCVCAHIHVCAHRYHGTCVKVRGQLEESVLSFHHVGSRIYLSLAGLMARTFTP